MLRGAVLELGAGVVDESGLGSLPKTITVLRAAIGEVVWTGRGGGASAYTAGMRLLAVAVCLLALTDPASGQMTERQKISELETLAGFYAKNYAPAEWKKAAFEFDVLDLRPWVERVKGTADDHEYFDVLAEYVASLRDGHTNLLIPASFSASLGLTVDLYEGKVLIDSITRSVLPQARYPFEVGDEVLTVDWVDVAEWIARLRKYYPAGNERTSRRLATAAIVARSQSRIPWLNRLGESAELIIRRQNGALETYAIPWRKTGTPVEFGGPVPDLIRSRAARERGGQTENDLLAPWQRPLEPLMTAMAAEEDRAALGVGTQAPWYALPEGFEQRLGRLSSDNFHSGRYQAEGLRIGLIRIPSFSPVGSTSTAVSNFDREIAWMQENTDGLIIDATRNPGGLVNYVEELCRRLIPENFRPMGFEVRATLYYVDLFKQVAALARALNQPEWMVEGYQERVKQVEEAYRSNRGKTPPVSLTNPWLELDPVKNGAGEVLAYQKPLMVLVDDFSSSGADAFPATIQDAKRGLIFGYRTNGLGGSVMEASRILPYSEFGTRYTATQMIRKGSVKTPELPEAPYVENIGVRPDIEYDAMTRENLMNQWRPYVQAFTRAMADHIRSPK